MITIENSVKYEYKAQLNTCDVRLPSIYLAKSYITIKKFEFN